MPPADHDSPRIPGPVGYIPDPLFAEKRRLYHAVDQFALEMKARLTRKLDAGWGGWDNPTVLPDEDVHRQMVLCAHKDLNANGQEADVANFALFLWWRRLHSPAAANSVPVPDKRPAL